MPGVGASRCGPRDTWGSKPGALGIPGRALGLAKPGVPLSEGP